MLRVRAMSSRWTTGTSVPACSRRASGVAEQLRRVLARARVGGEARQHRARCRSDREDVALCVDAVRQPSRADGEMELDGLDRRSGGRVAAATEPFEHRDAGLRREDDGAVLQPASAVQRTAEGRVGSGRVAGVQQRPAEARQQRTVEAAQARARR